MRWCKLKYDLLVTFMLVLLPHHFIWEKKKKKLRANFQTKRLAITDPRIIHYLRKLTRSKILVTFSMNLGYCSRNERK